MIVPTVFEQSDTDCSLALVEGLKAIQKWPIDVN